VDLRIRSVSGRSGPRGAARVAALAGALCLTVPATAAAAGVQPLPPKLTALHFPAPFVPQQLAAAAGRIWVLGTDSPRTDTSCALEEITPSTMATRFFPIPACATDIAASGGRIYLVASEDVPGTAATGQQHLEVFDPRRGKARVLAPVVMHIFGSAIAHTNFTSGDGSLWLYGDNMPAGPQVVRISPQSGAVTATFTSPPEIGGIFPAVAATAAGLWLGGGPGGPPGLEWVRGATATASATTVYSGPSRSSILWLSAVGDLVWAGVVDDGPGEVPSDVTHLVAVDAKGVVAVTSPSELIGDFPLVSTPDGHLWSMSWVGSCSGTEELVEIDPTTGSSHTVDSLKAPPGACDDADTGSQVAAVGHDVFALIPTGSAGSAVLYRAET
jgi:hypothetical protein